MSKFAIRIIQMQEKEVEIEAISLDEAKDIVFEKLDNQEIELVYTPTKVFVKSADDPHVHLPQDDQWTLDMEF